MLNIAIVQGRLCSDPELRRTENGTSVTTIRIAVERSYVKDGEERQADFLDCVLWRSQAEFVSKYFTKGDLIIVKGQIQTRNYEDKNGNKRTAVEIVSDSVYFSGKKSNKNEENAEQGETKDIPDEFDDDLPF